jgi:tripartite-type tricarboxylate transporter receptor subunit TctC
MGRKRPSLKVKTAMIVIMLFFPSVFLPDAFSQERFPVRPVTVKIVFPPGGSVDTGCRPLFEAATKIMGQPVVAHNQPGASGTLGPSSLKAVKPDGYTLSTALITLLSLPYMEDVVFDPMKDFTYIIQLFASQFGIMVRADSPWKTLKDLVEYARQHPNEIKYSASTPGNIHQFAMQEIALREKIKWDIVPYPGGGQAVMALLGGHVQVTSQDLASAVAQIESGKVRILAVYAGGSATERSKKFPNVPTLKEIGYPHWTAPVGIVGPAGMDRRIVRFLHDSFKKAMENPTFLSTIDKFDVVSSYLNTEDYDRYMRENYTIFGEAVRQAGLQKKK